MSQVRALHDSLIVFLVFCMNQTSDGKGGKET